MNESIVRQAREVARLRSYCELQRERLERGEYNHRLFVERDLFYLSQAEKLLCDLVIKQLESEENPS